MKYELLLLNIIRNAERQAIHFRECLGQHLIASYVKQFGYGAKVYSGDILNAKMIISKEIQKSNVGIIGFYVAADNIVMISHLIKWVKENYDSKYVVVGGPEAYSLGKDFLEETKCDYIIVGEGEVPMLNLMKYLYDDEGYLDEIKSLRFLNKTGNYVSNPMENLIENLDLIPFPDNANSLNKGFRMGEAIGILTGRGCPYNCSFCFEGATSKSVRYRSVENVLAEIEDVRAKNATLQCINIYDDTFTLDAKRVLAICNYMKKNNLNWTCEGHVARISNNPDLIKAMVDSGLVAMQIGIESGSQRVLDGYKKNITPDMIERVVEICKEAEVPTLEGNYIIGGAFETEETLQESLEHAKRLITKGRGMIEISTVFFSPYFGTPITKNPDKFDMSINTEAVFHNVVTMRDVVVETKELSYIDILRWKEHFDEQLRQQYYAVAKTCTKKEILSKICPERKRLRINQNWMSAWGKIPYISEFSMHVSEEEQTISSSKFPIRTINNYCYNNGIFQAQDIEVRGAEAAALYWANGKKTILEIAKILQCDETELKKIYRGLNEKCLIYFSEF